jgi:manganese/zinc/iron transport system permease protein
MNDILADLLRVLSLRDYNTRVVLLGNALLGVCGGVVGVFMLLRKRSLVGDVVAHASLPGVAVAFLVMETLRPGSGKSLPGLLAGAVVTGLLGVLCALAVTRLTRLKEDAALAIVLSIFYGLGAALLTVIQGLPGGSQAGLQDFIFGKVAGMSARDVWLIAGAALVALVVCGLLFKELTVLCFDDDFAATSGWPVGPLDVLLMGLVVGVTVTGLQSVGLVLVVAILIIPPAAARFWTDRLGLMTAVSATLGGAGALFGSVASAAVPKLAPGAMIVVTQAALFLLSLLFGLRRGLLWRWTHHFGLRRSVGRLDLMRAFYEVLESRHTGEPDATAEPTAEPLRLTESVLSFDDLLRARHWTAWRVRRLLSRGMRAGLIEPAAGGYRLTETGAEEARRVTRNHRLWELFLITYADIAPSHVDRAADQIEHSLEPKIIDELERQLAKRHPRLAMPASPHRLD